MIISYDIADVAPYINWAYFFFAWQVRKQEDQQRLQAEATHFLNQLDNSYCTHAIFLIADAHSEGDDVMIDLPDGVVRLPLLRQQSGNPCLCLADFISPHRDRIGLFAATADARLETHFDKDPYQKMMAQLLADRLAEATAELMHQQVRRRYWGYAPHEQLTIADMQQEHFLGIRPAVGYPSLPDNSLNFLLDNILHFSQIGITLTESGAMRPHASVSGLMMAHPHARYFSVGKIGDDQLADYARRRGLDLGTTRKFLARNL